jgi:outer membrane protein
MRHIQIAALFFSALSVIVGGNAIAADMPVKAVAPLPDPLSPWYVHVGPGGLFYHEGATIKAGGAIIPGADISQKWSPTVMVEAGYYLTPNWAVSLTGGYPPTVKVYGAGSIAGLGKLGESTYGPMALTAHYHFDGLGRFRPYIGAGPAYMIVFGTKDAALTNVQVENSWGFVGQVGFDYMIDRHWGWFFDLKQAYLRTNASGNLPGRVPVPVTARVKLDPTVLHTGLVYRF